MANAYYTFAGSEFIPGTKVRSDGVNVQYQALETAFDLLPTTPAAISTGTATYAGLTTGTSTAYVATPPDSRAADADGDEIVILIDETNTGPSTLDVDGNGAQSIVRPDGAALAANDLLIGLMYTLRYNLANTRWQMISTANSYLVDVTAQAVAAAASASAAATSESNAATSESNAATSEANALASEVIAGQWAVHPEDDDLDSAPGQFSALHWAAKSAASTSGGLIIGTGVVAPTTTGPFDYDAQIDFENANNLLTGNVGWIASGDFGLESKAHGALIALRGEDDAGVSQLVFSADPDGAGALYQAGVLKMITTVSGVSAISSSTGDEEVPDPITAVVQFLSSDFNVYSQFGHQASANLGFTNLAHGGAIQFLGESSAGVLRNLLLADPDTGVSLYHAGVRTIDTAVGRATIRSVTSTDTENRQLIFEHQDGTDRAYIGQVGSAIFRMRNLINSGHLNLEATNSSAAVRTLINADPDADVSIYDPVGNVLRFRVTATGRVALRSDGNTDAEGRVVQLEHQDGTLRAFLGQNGSSTLEFSNRITSGHATITAQDAGTTNRTGFRFDPDIGVTLFDDENAERFSTISGGIARLHSDGNTDAELRRLDLVHQNGTTRGIIGHNGDDDLLIRNVINAGHVLLQGTNTGASTRTLIQADPDADIRFMYPAANAIRARTHSSGAFEIRSDGSLDTETRTVQFTHQDGTVRGRVGHVGGDQLFILNDIDGGNVEIRASDAVSAQRTAFIFDPDGILTLRGDTSMALQANAGENGIFINQNGSVDLYYDNLLAATTNAAGFVVLDTAGDDPSISLTQDDGTTRACYLQGGANTMTLHSDIAGNAVIIQGDDIGGTPRVILTADPDANSELRGDVEVRLGVGPTPEYAFQGILNSYSEIRHNNTATLRTDATGILVGDTAGSDPRITLRASIVSTDNAYIEANNGTGLTIRQLVHGLNVVIDAEDAGGTPQTILNADPDAATILRGDTNLELEVAGGENALVATANAGVALYHNNLAKFQTVLQGTNDKITGADVTGADGNLASVGLAIIKNETTTFDTAATHTPFQLGNAHEMLYYAGTGSANWDTYANTGSSQTDIPVGAIWMIQMNGSGSLTFRGGTGVTIRFWTGDGSAPADADVTLARGSVATVRKLSATIYDIWGNGGLS